MATLASDWLTQFELLLKIGCRDLLQTGQERTLQGPGHVLLLFMWIRNPVWPPLPFANIHEANNLQDIFLKLKLISKIKAKVIYTEGNLLH